MLSYMCAHDHLPFVKYLSVGSPSEPRFISISTPLSSQKSLATTTITTQDPCYAKFEVSLPIWLKCELAMITSQVQRRSPLVGGGFMLCYMCAHNCPPFLKHSSVGFPIEN